MLDHRPDSAAVEKESMTSTFVPPMKKQHPTLRPGHRSHRFHHRWKPRRSLLILGLAAVSLFVFDRATVRYAQSASSPSSDLSTLQIMDPVTYSKAAYQAASPEQLAKAAFVTFEILDPVQAQADADRAKAPEQRAQEAASAHGILKPISRAEFRDAKTPEQIQGLEAQERLILNPVQP
jgi:hypothetical protein